MSDRRSREAARRVMTLARETKHQFELASLGLAWPRDEDRAFHHADLASAHLDRLSAELMAVRPDAFDSSSLRRLQSDLSAASGFAMKVADRVLKTSQPYLSEGYSEYARHLQVMADQTSELLLDAEASDSAVARQRDAERRLQAEAAARAVGAAWSRLGFTTQLSIIAGLASLVITVLLFKLLLG